MWFPIQETFSSNTNSSSRADSKGFRPKTVIHLFLLIIMYISPTTRSGKRDSEHRPLPYQAVSIPTDGEAPSSSCAGVILSFPQVGSNYLLCILKLSDISVLPEGYKIQGIVKRLWLTSALSVSKDTVLPPPTKNTTDHERQQQKWLSGRDMRRKATTFRHCSRVRNQKCSVLQGIEHSEI